MLKKRIIPCMDIRENIVVKGVHFERLVEAGDPVALAGKYAAEGADELVFLDITASLERRAPLSELVARIAAYIDIPFTVGGGIRNLDDARQLLDAGADKLSINSASVQHPRLISELANAFGSQCVVQAIDTKYVQGSWQVFTHGGRQISRYSCLEWAQEAVQRGAGEILLTSMGHDGAQQGFALDITETVATSVPVPVIASGGAGSKAHFASLFTQTKANAGLAASIFHFGQLSIPELKQYLQHQNIPVR